MKIVKFEEFLKIENFCKKSTIISNIFFTYFLKWFLFIISFSTFHGFFNNQFVANFRKRAWRTELMQWRKHVRIKYGGRVGVGQGQREREQVQLQVRVVQLQREGGARLSYVCHQPQLSSTARRSCSTAAMLCCGRRKVSIHYF